MPSTKSINLALQGGGAHGAFTWGVLDALADEPRLVIDGITATSAGAMNAAVYAHGMAQDGAKGAKKALHDFWEDISQEGSSYGTSGNVQSAFLSGMEAFSRSMYYKFFENFTNLFSPYEFNPLNINPLRDVLERHVEFDHLDSCQTKLFICATNVRSNKIKIFYNEEVTADAVLASACLPMLFQAVEIDGEAYWDGGYMGNPALYPLVYNTDTEDIIIVHINPIERDEVPHTSEEIANRVNEISFNSSLLREMRAFEFARTLVEEDWIKPEYKGHFRFNHLRMHAIRADEVTSQYSMASKFTPDWDFLCGLRDQGRKVAKKWLKKNFDDIGTRSTLDLRAMFE